MGQFRWGVGQLCSSRLNLHSLACIASDRVTNTHHSTVNIVNCLWISRFWNMVVGQVNCCTNKWHVCYLSLGQLNNVMNVIPWTCVGSPAGCDRTVLCAGLMCAVAVTYLMNLIIWHSCNHAVSFLTFGRYSCHLWTTKLFHPGMAYLLVCNNSLLEFLWPWSQYNWLVHDV